MPWGRKVVEQRPVPNLASPGLFRAGEAGHLCPVRSALGAKIPRNGGLEKPGVSITMIHEQRGTSTPWFDQRDIRMLVHREWVQIVKVAEHLGSR